MKRRDFLKSTAASATLLTPAKLAHPATIYSIGASRSPPPPSPPPPAVANGFTNLTFYDNFLGNSVDINNTLMPGFKWYNAQWFNSEINRPNEYSYNFVPGTVPPTTALIIAGTQGNSTLVGGSLLNLSTPPMANPVYRTRLWSAGFLGCTSNNVIQNSGNLLLSPWQEIGNNTTQPHGTLVTDLGAGSAPDAVSHAFRINMGAFPGTNTGIQQQPFTGTSATPRAGTFNIWLRSSPVNGAKYVHLLTGGGGPSASSHQKVFLSPNWQLFKYNMWFNSLLQGSGGFTSTPMLYIGNPSETSSTPDPTLVGNFSNVDVFLPQFFTTSNPASNWVGNLIQPTGGYFEFRAAFERGNTSSFNMGYLTFWMQQLIGNQIQSARPINGNFSEFDFMEWTTAGPPNTPTCSIHLWNSVDGSAAATVTGGGTQNINLSTIGFSLNDPTFHKWGFLWKTIAQNGGTNGVVRLYFDQTAYPTFDNTYLSSDNSTYGVESNPWVLAIDGLFGCPMLIDYVQVWQ